MDIAVENNGSSLVAVFSGSASIEDSDEIVEKMSEVLKVPEQPLTLDLAAIVESDVTFFQALIALSNSLIKNKLHLSIRELDASHQVCRQASMLGINFENFATVVRAPT